VATDRVDYSPGTTVSISGTGFQPEERVRLKILQANLRENDGPEHQPWLVRADANGRLQATWLVKAHESGATLKLSAEGLTSNRRAHVTFTDASVAAATGGGAIPAETYNGPYAALTGPAITETIVGDISQGTLVLTTPAGFVFDTNPPLPFITLGGDSNNKNINDLTNGSIISLAVTTNTLSFTINTKSHGQTKNTLTYSNVRVRPTAPTPLAFGNLTNTGTATFPNANTNFGTLTEIAGTNVSLAVTGFPSPQVAGPPGSVTVAARDQFGNTVTSYNGTIHFSSSDAQAVLPVDYSFVSADNGSHTFTNGAILLTIGTQSITASNMAPASFSGTQSGIVINPTSADHLAFATQPGSATYGSLLSPQPVVVSQDKFGNNSTVGLGASKMVTVTLTSGSGLLIGTSSFDIGTASGNGTAVFTNLKVNAAGAGKRLTASAAGLTNILSAAFTIAQATVTANVTVSNKVYDATTGASIATRGLTGVLGGDNVLLVGGTASFATKTVANGKTVTVTGLGLSGTAATNYVLLSTTATNSANITSAPLSITGVTANNKVYDGTTADTLGGTAALSGVIGLDTVTLSGTPSATFATKNVGTNKPVTGTGYTTTGTDSGNYTLAQPTGLTANITTAGLTVSGITAGNKVYNATTNATLNTSGANLTGVASGDTVTLNTASATGVFATKNIGAGKTVTVSGLTISGADAANYTLTQPTTAANITAAGLTVSGITASNRVYNATTNATLNLTGATLHGVLGTDSVTLNTGSAIGTFATKTVGTGKTVTISGLTVSGTDATNYSLTQPTTTANITPAALTVTAAAADKVYDGTPAASVTLNDNRLAGDNLTDTYTSAAFADKNVGNGKTVNVTGISVTGADATNYTFNTSATATAAITPATLTGTAGDAVRVYGQTNAAFIAAYTGFVNGEDGSILAGTLNISTTATTNSPVGTYPITASGQSAPNYTVQYVNGTLTITPAYLCAAANNASRLYGHPNPGFTGTITGFVCSQNSSVLGGSLGFSTTAQPNSLPGNYPIVPSGLVSANYSIVYSNGTLVVTSTNLPPVLAVITNATIRPGQLLRFALAGSDPDGDHLTFSLDPGAPAGAVITNLVTRRPGFSPILVTNTVFSWTPTRAQASSTNLITVRVTDNGGPPMSAAQTFTVVVLDYLEITIGSTALESGQSAAVPINLASSDGVTNLDFIVGWPADYLSNAALVVTAPQVGTSSLQDQGTNLVLTFQAIPGQVLQGTQQLAQLSFVAVSNQFSAFVPLPIANPTAAKPDGTAYTNYITPTATIVVIEGEPLLSAAFSPQSGRELTLYGRLGHSYQLQSTANLAPSGPWTPEWDYVQTNNAITISVPAVQPVIFYRIFAP
jgi:hypothetical protein